MPGTLEGGRKAAATNKAKYGKEFYANIGRKGGRNGHTGGFAANPELARIAGAKGGKKSKRGPAKRGGRVINANYTKDQLERIREELGWNDGQSTAAHRYEYETTDGEAGIAEYCTTPYRGVPYCQLDDGTEVYGIKQYKKVPKEEEE